MPSSKPRAQGGGRAANSEPRTQVFKEFGGCNFELSPRDFTLGKPVYQEQSDLQMNYVVIQNNASISSNKTIETRNNLVTLFTAPTGRTFTDACILIGRELFIGLDNGDLKYGNIDGNTLSNVTLTNNTDGTPAHHWRSLAYADDKLIGTTQENQLWTGTVSSHTISNARRVPDPSVLTVANNLTAKGSLSISATMDDTHPYRVAVAYAYINKYGPTAHSPQLTFYANYPVDEWHGGRYLQIHGTASTGYAIQAVEFYYTTGNSSSLLFAGRNDIPSGNGGAWSFNWFGYLDTTTMWSVANLIAPTENYTEGAKASRVACIDSRMYFWGSSSEPQRLYIGGNPGNLFSISPGTGGGFVDIEPGTGQDIRVVTKYKTQSGASIITMLCNSKNSSMEQRFNLVENSVSLSNEQSMKSWQAEQVAGSVGCKSYNGALVCEDGLYSVSRYGLALTTMTMEYNSQIRANYVSDPIKPAFIDKNRSLLSNSALIECDGVIYLAFGRDDSTLDNILFCYDIDQKAWWTVSLDIDEAILNMIHVDYEGYREGIGIITANHIYLLPLTKNDTISTNANFQVTLQTGELSTQQPQQGWFYLSQLEFRFDYFIGDITIELTGIDQFGRKVSTKKEISHTSTVYNDVEHMRIDLRLQSYQIRITGQARFRLTHFIAKLYVMSAKQGLVWGFDDSQSFREFGDIHPTFHNYNDIKQAIIP
jgi:hypothetical protein